MFVDLQLHQYPLGLRIIIFLVLTSLTIRYTRRGVQNGILIGLAAGMNLFELFHGDFGKALPIITLERLVWSIILGVFLIKRSKGETNRLPLDLVERSILVYFFVIMISLFMHRSYTTTAGGWHLTDFSRGYAIPFAAYFIARRSITNSQQLRSFLIGLGAIALYLAFTGIAEVCNIHWLIFPRYILDPKIGIHFGQARGIFLNASFLGLAIGMALPICIWHFFTDRGIRQWLWPVLAVLSLIPLIYTIQRAAWLGAIGAVAVSVMAWPRRRFVLTGILVFIASLGFLIMSDLLMRKVEAKIGDAGTVDFRVQLIKRSLAMIRAHPLTGIGFNLFSAELPNYTVPGEFGSGTYPSHNTVFTVFVELGIVGLLPFLAIFGSLLCQSAWIYWQHQELRAFIGMLWGLSVALLTMMVMVEVRGALYANALFYALWGMSIEAMRQYGVKQQVLRYRQDISRLKPAEVIIRGSQQ
jgi:O-antigen ligase